MFARVILIRALSCIAAEGYLTKDQSLVKDVPSTSSRVTSSLQIDDIITASDEDAYGARADDIINWITTFPTADNDYLNNCKLSIAIADTTPHKTIGYLTSLVPAYARHLESALGLDKVTQVNAFAADAGTAYDGTGEVINVQKLPAFTKVSIVDTNGYLVTFSTSKGTKKDLTIPAIGDNISIAGRVYRNKFSTPFETSLSSPTIKKL